MTKQTRRTFLKHTAAASAAFSTFTIAGTKSSGRVIGANDTIRIGVAGINNRGNSHINAFTGQDKVEVTYLIDPDSRLFDSRSKDVAERGGKAPKCVQDIREALEDPNLDAVSVATCNHWHSLITIWACQAGKDVYVEKPLSHNVYEGRVCVEAARKHNRIVQHGTQNRSSQGRAREIAAVQSGKYGKLLVSKGYCAKPRWSIGREPVTSPPAGLDFDLWLGPAPKQDYHGNLVHYDWHWFWDTGNGDVGNQGVHQMDIARWAIKDATHPKSVWSLGGRFGYEDQGETPNTLLSVFDYGDTTLLFETRGLVGKNDDFPSKITNEFYMEEGMIADGRFHPYQGGDAERVSGGTPDEITVSDPFENFIYAMRTRRVEDLNADVEKGHYSSALCHLGNISYRLGESVPFNKQAKSLGDNKQVVESYEKIQDNLRAAGVNLQETNYALGRTLQFDPQSERFVGDDEANQLLTRDYRPPFVVPSPSEV
ncbi:MAG: Gfo/Idh/MocA family oxidoreductase [Pirellulales bacterium]